MPALGILLVLRGRKQHQCAECDRTLEPGEWHTALVGRTQTGKHFTSRFCQQCLWLRIGKVMANPRLSAKMRRSKPLAELDPETRLARHRLVMLRAYHRRHGHEKRVAELTTLIEATGVPAPSRDGTKAAKVATIDLAFRQEYLKRLKADIGRFKSYKRVPKVARDWFEQWAGDAGATGFATVEEALAHLEAKHAEG